MGTTLAILAVAAVTSVGWVWTVNSAHTPEIPPAEIIAARFPAEADTQRSKSAAAVALPRAHGGKQTSQTMTAALDWLSPDLFFENPDWNLATGASLEMPVTGSVNPSAKIPFKDVMLPRPSGRTASMFTDAQIASIRARLKLTPEQEELWPAVEEGLREIAWRRERLDAKTAALDPKSLRKLKTAIIPFLKKLRTDQKDELRMIAHIMGIKKLVAQL